MPGTEGRARMWHRTQPKGFVTRYKVRLPARAGPGPAIDEAIARDKAVKKWLRRRKLELIGKDNPKWEDQTISSGLDSVMPAKAGIQTGGGGGGEADLDPRFRGDDGEARLRA